MKKLLFLTLFAVCSIVSALPQKSDKISRVLEYRPAPGQHINRMFPPPELSDTYENALKFANDCLIGNKSMLGLGSFGGYVIVGFDHSIINIKNEYDFKGLGNAFPGSSEPGIVMVCQDLNKNGQPDENEPWYELAGSEYSNPQTIKNYEITYFRPNPDKQRKNISWKDNQGQEGEISHISFATQETMYPLWVKEDQITFKGTKLRNTAHDTSGKGTYWVLDAFDWGYIDNNSNADEITKNGFKIEWAVDAEGNPVELDYIDFIKVYTGQLQEAGWLGETSTEIVGIIDLHPDAIISNIDNTVIDNTNLLITQNQITILDNSDEQYQSNIYSITGNLMISNVNTKHIDISGLPSGVYLIRIKTPNNLFTQKFIKR